MADRMKPGQSEHGSVESVLRTAHGLLKAGKYGDAITPLLRAAELLPDNPVGTSSTISGARTCSRGSSRRPSPRCVAPPRSVRRSRAHPLEPRPGARPGRRLRGGPRRAPPGHRARAALGRGARARGRHPAAEGPARRRRWPSTSGPSRWRPRRRSASCCGAKARVAQDRAAEAEALLGQLIARDPSSSEAHLVLAHLLTEAGRFDDAAASFERSIALAPWQATARPRAQCVEEADGGRSAAGRSGSRPGSPRTDVAERQRMTLRFRRRARRSTIGRDLRRRHPALRRRQRDPPPAHPGPSSSSPVP